MRRHESLIMIESYRRRIFLSPCHLEAIQVYNEVVNLPLLVEEYKLPEMDFRNIFFSTMIQCGVEEFVMISSNPKRDTPNFDSDFLSSRIIFDRKLSTQYFKIFDKINPLFIGHHENEKLEKADRNEAHSARSFITDLLFGMKTNLGSVNITLYPYPDLMRLNTFLEPELYYPIKNLMSLIEKDNLKLPLPTKSILHKDILKYEEIIESSLFSKYVLAHQNFERNSLPKYRALTQIRKDAKNLQNRFSKYINLKEILINSLNVIPPSVELFGGKIYGSVAEKLLKIMEPIFKDNISNNRRFINYQFTPITEDVLKKRLFNYLRR